MGIGVPGSGKTTALKSLALKYSYTYISPDELRQAISGSQTDQTQNEEVWNATRQLTSEALKNGKDVVLDASFTKLNERKRFIAFARENGADKIQGLYASIPIETSISRNLARDRQVPEYAIKRMHSQLTQFPPEVEDGFDSVFDIDEFQKLNRAEVAIKDGIKVRNFPNRLH